MTELTVIPGGNDPVGPKGEWEGDIDESGADFQGRASTGGREFKHATEDFLVGLGVQINSRGREVGPYRIDLEIRGSNGHRFGILAHGTFDDGSQAGLRRTDTVKKMGFDAWQIRRRLPGLKLIAIVSHLPKPLTAASKQLADISDHLYDVVAIGDMQATERLRHLLTDRALPDVVTAAWRDQPTLFEPSLFDSPDNEDI